VLVGGVVVLSNTAPSGVIVDVISVLGVSIPPAFDSPESVGVFVPVWDVWVGVDIVVVGSCVVPASCSHHVFPTDVRERPVVSKSF